MIGHFLDHGQKTFAGKFHCSMEIESYQISEKSHCGSKKKKRIQIFSGSWVEALLKAHIVCIPNSTIDFVGLLLHLKKKSLKL